MRKEIGCRLRYIIVGFLLAQIMLWCHHLKFLPSSRKHYRHYFFINSTTKYSLEKKIGLGCQIPQLSPWPKNTVMGSFKVNWPPPRCYNSSRSLFKIDYENNLIRLQPSPKHWTDSLWKTVKCFYTPKIRVADEPDFVYLKNTPIIEITLEKTKLENLDHLYVWCQIRTGRIIYEDYLSLVEIKPELESKINNARKDQSEFYSLLIFGQDSSSHMNFIRTMPKVHEYLKKELDAVEFHGFNSLGPTTLWSLNPFLTGLELTEFTRTCYGDGSFKDNCPFIWKEFEKHGYRTAFDEDLNYPTLFTPVGPHPFKSQPFHYDFRTVSNVLYEIQRGHKKINERNPYCFGSRLRMSVLLDNMLRMATTFHDKPHWTLVWAESLSHYENSLSRFGEASALDALKYLREKKLLNQTILIFMSDHGMWWRDFVKNKEQGFLEQRLPILYIALPPKFKRNFPLATTNLAENAKKLTTTFDIHEMMRDLLNLSALTDEKIEERGREASHSLRRNVSLFLPINPNRSCAMAGITMISCACIPRKSALVSDPIVVEGAQFVVKKINEKIQDYVECSTLELANITEVFVTGINEDRGALSQKLKTNKETVAESHGDYLEIAFDTKPGRGRFYVALIVNGFDGSFQIDGLARTSMYGNDADCMGLKDLKPFCHCL